MSNLSTEVLRSEIKRLNLVIFDSLYACRIRQCDYYDIDYIEKVGLYTTGLPWLDAELDNQWMDVGFSINTMTELVRDGYNFILVDPKTYSGIVYKSITDYMRYWAELSDRHPNTPLPSQEDFEALDKLAQLVYKQYRGYETPEESSGLAARLRAQRSRLFTINTPNKAPDKPLDELGTAINKEHESMMDMFAYRLVSKRAPKDDAGEDESL